jgi:O-antigen ligase
MTKLTKLLRFAEQAFTVLSLIHYSGGPLVVILNGGANEGEDGGGIPADYALVQLIFLLIYGVTFLLLVARWKKVTYLLSKDRFIWVLIAVAVFSMFWSDAPDVTKTRTIALVGTTLFGFYLASRYSMKQQLQLLAWAFGISIVLSFMFAVGVPKLGIMGGLHAGKWRGIYAHKNVLGKMMVMSALIFLLLAISAKRNRRILWGGFSLSAMLIVLSASSTSLVNLIALIAAFFALRTLRLRYEQMIPALLAIAIVAGSLQLLYTANADALLGLFGKDATLSGRTDMWPYVLEKIWERPWLGYGYSGFWRGLDGESAYIWYATRWTPPNAHNGLLDLWLDLGLLGVSIYLLGFLTSFIRAIARVRLSRTTEEFWPVIYMLYMVLANLTESTMLERNSLYWVLFAALILSIRLPIEGRTETFTSTEQQTVRVSSNHLIN